MRLRKILPLLVGKRKPNRSISPPLHAYDCVIMRVQLTLRAVKEVRRMSKKKHVRSGTPTTVGRNTQVKSKAQSKTKGKTNVVWHQTAEEATLAAKPHYNGFACGHGAHGDYKYNRAKAKRTWKNQIRQEGASRGSFPLMCNNYSTTTLLFDGQLLFDISKVPDQKGVGNRLLNSDGTRHNT